MTTGPAVDAIVDRAAGLLHREIGLRPDPSMLTRLRRCLRDEAAARGLEAEAYLDTLATDGAVRQRLFDAITVQETSFFRHPGQFEALGHHVLANLEPPVTIWSAGCANGQEPYSLAMVLDEHGSEASVVATDVSMLAVERTAAARYATRELTGLSSARQSQYLTGGPEEWEIRPFLRDRVTVQHHNLVTDALPARLSRCQVVFCRNVLIYFSPDQARTFLTRLAAQLQAGAYLFLGYAETIWQVTDLFQPVRIGESFEYHRRRDGAAPTPPAARSVGPAPVGRRGRSTPRPPAKAIVRPVAPLSPPDDAPATFPEQALQLASAGQAAAAARDYPAAIAAFRKCVYLAPDDPMGHVHLGLALEASGDRASATRAFQAARSALGRYDSSEAMTALGGYRVEELAGLLESKLAGPCP